MELKPVLRLRQTEMQEKHRKYKNRSLFKSIDSRNEKSLNLLKTPECSAPLFTPEPNSILTEREQKGKEEQFGFRL